ncbi:hypothetical protein AYM02_10365 [Coxiella burnetii]|uniref:hypothetical protein n=2 Tax=Coxiella burnetii TaxID=777 RepID=UPI0005947C55|nr:hypothetical protein AYM02_10365 [Coxiella burnetii]PNT83625.1 hypothetical protein C2L93_08120 [Coxiella burnetii]
MVANLNCDAGYTNATAFFSSKLIVDNKGGSIYVWSEAKYGNYYYSAVFHFASYAYFLKNLKPSSSREAVCCSIEAYKTFTAESGDPD